MIYDYNMNMEDKKKKLYVVPGFKETTEDQNYTEIIEYAQNLNLEVVPISVDWDHDIDMKDYVEEVSEQLPDESSDYILGFSFGAYITYLLSQKKKFAGYIFCTISPYFKETIKEIPQKAKDYFGPNFIESVGRNSLHEGNKSNAWFLVGEKDWTLAHYINKEARDAWSGKGEFIMVKNASHVLAQKNYVEEVKWILKNLSREEE